MTLWLAIQVIQIGIFVQFDQAHWLCLSQRKFRVSVEGEMSTPRIMQAGVPQGSVLSPALFNLYINDAPVMPLCRQGLKPATPLGDTCGYLLRIQGGKTTKQSTMHN
jgi:hypothetical protein